jgi:hypothetical protein
MGQTPPWDEVLFSWLHVSDIHIGHGDASHGWDQRLVLDTLRADVGSLLRDGRVPRPDALMVTGDVAFSGATRATDEYERAGEWLTSLAGEVGLGASGVFVVPGNHDVQRAVDASDDSVRRLLRGLRKGEDPLDESLKKSADAAMLSQRMANYLAFARGFGAGAESATPALYWRHTLQAKCGLEVCIAGLNTALLAADDQDHGRLRLGKAQLAHALLERGSAPRVVMVLSHHPFSDGWLADEKDVSSWLRNRAQLHLSGHVHVANSEQIVSGGGSSFIRVSAGAAHGDADASVPASHGYNFGAIVRRKTGELGVVVWPRRWSPGKAGFRRDEESVPDHEEYSFQSIVGVRLAPSAPSEPKRTERENIGGSPPLPERREATQIWALPARFQSALPGP